MNSDQSAPPRRPRIRFIRGWLALAIANLLAVTALIAALELALVIMLNHPPPVRLILRALSGYYHEADRPIIQFDPECAEFDDGLGYTLKPGQCRFHAREFDTRVVANSTGVRDDEDSLRLPEIIVLGDSFSMGWGVEGNETFAQLLEIRCHMKVLNAAVSSYGTAREMALLRRLDRSAVKWLIIQYSDNDYGENAAFVANSRKLSPMRRQNYERVRDNLHADRKYWPGKHMVGFFAHLGSKIRYRASGPAIKVTNERPPAADDLGEVGAFLQALSTAPDLPADVRVLVMEINGSSRNDNQFVTELRHAISSVVNEQSPLSITAIDLSQYLTLDQFFKLDEHLSPRGHATVADVIGRTIGCDAQDTH